MTNICDRTLYAFQIRQSDLYSTPCKSTWKFYQMKHIFSLTDFSGLALSHTSHNYNSKTAWIIYVKKEKSAFSKVNKKETYTHTHAALRVLVHSFVFQLVERSAPHSVTLNYFGTCKICEVLNTAFVSFFYTKSVGNISRAGKYMRVHLKIQVKPHAGQYEKTSLKPSDSNKNLVDRHTHTHFS